MEYNKVLDDLNEDDETCKQKNQDELESLGVNIVDVNWLNSLPKKKFIDSDGKLFWIYFPARVGSLHE